MPSATFSIHRQTSAAAALASGLTPQDGHSFFVRSGDLPVDVYRFDFLTGAREFVRRLRPSDPTGMDRLSGVFMTPDGKYYSYSGPRELSNLYVVAGLK
jgi:hypothetical protein